MLSTVRKSILVIVTGLLPNGGAFWAEPPVLTVCDAIRHCKQLHGKTVRIRGRYVVGPHSRSVFDLSCGMSYNEGSPTVPPVLALYSIVGEAGSDRAAMNEIDIFTHAHQKELEREEVVLTLEGRFECSGRIHFTKDENGELRGSGFGPRGLWQGRLVLKRLIEIKALGDGNVERTDAPRQ